MHVRDAVDEEIESIRDVALASLTASYGHAVAEELLGDAVERWYDADELGEDVTDPNTVFLVAEIDDDVVGFAESYVIDRRDRVGEIDWLHVHPDHRGEGVGSALLEAVETALRDADVDAVEGRVLVDNEAGVAFYERGGYDHAGDRYVDIGDETFTERVYRKRLTGTDGDRTASYETDDGEVVHVAFDRSERGGAAPFYAAYEDESHEARYGYLCGNCEGTNVAVDTMDRVECLDCGNRRKPTRWDAAY